jgi:hypothetical protein
MYPELQALIHEAEFQYLQKKDLDQLSSHVSSLQEKLATYQILREQEIEIFQAVADKLLDLFPQKNPQQIETVIRHWLLVTRYCAMAMLLNNPEFLERRLLEWLTDIVNAHELQALENSLYSILEAKLSKNLTEKQVAYLQPFLVQAKNALINPEVVMA